MVCKRINYTWTSGAESRTENSPETERSLVNLSVCGNNGQGTLTSYWGKKIIFHLVSAILNFKYAIRRQVVWKGINYTRSNGTRSETEINLLVCGEGQNTSSFLWSCVSWGECHITTES